MITHKKKKKKHTRWLTYLAKTSFWQDNKETSKCTSWPKLHEKWLRQQGHLLLFVRSKKGNHWLCFCLPCTASWFPSNVSLPIDLPHFSQAALMDATTVRAAFVSLTATQINYAAPQPRSMLFVPWKMQRTGQCLVNNDSSHVNNYVTMHDEQ